MGNLPNENWDIVNNEQPTTNHQPLRTNHKWI